MNPREVVNKIYGHGEFMILMAKVSLDDSDEHYPILSAVLTRHGHYPFDKDEENDLIFKEWIFKNNKWNEI